MYKPFVILPAMLLLALTMIIFTPYIQAQNLLVSEDFDTGNGSTPPAGWTIEQVTGTIPGISFVSSASNPVVQTTYAWQKFVSYNSYNIPGGSTRLKRTAALSILNHAFVMVDFNWYEDPGNPAATDNVEVQWSVDGVTWNTAASFNRFNAVAGWKTKNVLLPSGANNQATLYVGFLFTSANGNNCSLDNVVITDNPMPVVTIGSGNAFAGYPYYTGFNGARTQVLYTAAEFAAAGFGAGEITSIGFRVFSFSPQVMEGFTLKMGATSLTNLAGGYVSGLQTCYSAPYAVPGTGWRSISLSAPFSWNGTSNVVMETCFANNSQTYSSEVYATTLPGKTAMHYGNNVNECTTGSFYSFPDRPDIRAGFSPESFGVLRGYVLDGITLAPIDGAIVITSYGRDTTMADGAYTIYNVPPGTITANAVRTGYAKGTNNGIMATGAITFVNILMYHRATLSGMVKDTSTGAPVTGATVTVGTGADATSVMTTSDGTYFTGLLPVLGNQPVNISKTGFDSFTGTVMLTPDASVTSNAALYPTAIQPGPVTATPNDPLNPTGVNLSWVPPQGAYQLIYDDGSQENFAVWATAGNLRALRFTPAAWPVKITGGLVNHGTRFNYLYNMPLLPYTIMAYKADGPGGTPGTLLDSVTVSPLGFGWSSFTFATPVTLSSGEFYLAMKQSGTSPDAAGLAIDATTSQARSYEREVTSGGSWTAVPGNFMIRATMQGAGGPLLGDNPVEGDQPLGVSYEVWRFLNGNENNPAAWTSIWTGSGTTAVDNGWPTLPSGIYRWAVKAIYSPPGMRYSDASFSNILGKNWTATVDVCVTFPCPSVPNAGTQVVLTNMTYPDTVYTKITDNTGCVHFPAVWKGGYVLKIIRLPYQTNTLVITITSNSTFNLTETEQPAPPSGLAVNGSTLVASWNCPVSTSYFLDENWATSSFTTNQWDIGGSANWVISGTVGHPTPAVTFNSTPVLTNYHEYLSSPAYAGVNASQVSLQYDIFLQGNGTTYLNKMEVELWNGTNWTVLKTYSNATGSMVWTSETINITSITASPEFRIRFHASGTNSTSITRWGIDNIKIKNTTGSNGINPCVSGYNFYLNNALIGSSPTTSYTIPPGLTGYGQVCTACVQAVFGPVLSTQVCTGFTFSYPNPPLNLSGVFTSGITTLNWSPPAIASGVTGYNIYRGPTLLNPSPVTGLTYNDTPVPTGLNSYTVRAMYGAVQSIPAGPVVVNAVPVLNSLNNLTVGNGISACYNASQTITVAGAGSSFTIDNGGSATMIAGQNIQYFPGTMVNPGGYMWGYIAPSGPYCTVPSAPVLIAADEGPATTSDDLTFSIYPNPTRGSFMLSLKGEDQPWPTLVNVYTIMGNSVLSNVMEGEHSCTISLGDYPAGIYFVRVIRGNYVATKKIVRQ